MGDVPVLQQGIWSMPLSNSSHVCHRRMDTILRENDRLRAQVQELQTCLGNGDRVIEGLQSSKAEAERWDRLCMLRMHTFIANLSSCCVPSHLLPLALL